MPQSVVRVRCAEIKILKSGRDIGACLTGVEGAQAQSPRGYEAEDTSHYCDLVTLYCNSSFSL